jgi:hypothetical protein
VATRNSTSTPQDYHSSPFYIGETLTLNTRLRQHLKEARFFRVLTQQGDAGLESIKQGDRYFHYGYFKGKRHQDAKTCIIIVQQYLITEAVAQKLEPLLNQNLKTFKTHDLTFSGSASARAIYKPHATVKAERS